MKKVLIIGAGPAGLTAAYELLDKSADYEVTVLEESKYMGGICKTVDYKGNRMDMGGHRFFSKVDEVNEWWDRMLPMQGRSAKDYRKLRVRVPLKKGNPDPEKEDKVMLTRRRVSRIFFNKKFPPVRLKIHGKAQSGNAREERKEKRQRIDCINSDAIVIGILWTDESGSFIKIRRRGKLG